MANGESTDRPMDTDFLSNTQNQIIKGTGWPSPKRTDYQERLCELLDAKGSSVYPYPLGDLYRGAIRVWSDPHNSDRIAQAANSLRELLEKLLWLLFGYVKKTYSEFEEMRGEMEGLLLQYRATSDSKVKEKLHNKLEAYLKFNKDSHAPIAKQMGTAMGAIYTGDDKLTKDKEKRARKLWYELQACTHHGKCGADYFEKALDEFEKTVDLMLANVAAINQKEIHRIVLSNDRSNQGIEPLFRLIINNEANLKYFFELITKKSDESWLTIIRKRGYFRNPPAVEESNDGWIKIPFWLPMPYLVKMATCEPDKVAKIIAKLSVVDNPRVCEQIVEIATLLPHNLSVKLKEKIVEYTRKSSNIWRDGGAKLIIYWAERAQIGASLDLLRELVRFDSDPKDEKKRKQRSGYDHQQGDLEQVHLLMGSDLKPRHRMDRYFFRETMTNSVRPLIEKDPLGVAEVLIKAVSHLLALKFHDKEDLSGLNWHKPPRVRMLGDSNEPTEDTRGQEEVLVDTMMLACRKVYDKKQPEDVEKLNNILISCSEEWDFFKQRRMQLYADYPDLSKPWIRTLIINHKGYGKEPFGQDFWNMIKSACDHFSKALPTKDWLTKNDLTKIFEDINNVQLDERQRQIYTEDHLRYWQFSPFKSLLFDKYQDIYHNLMDTKPEEKRKEPIHYRPPHTDRMSRHDLSPFSHDEIVSWGDEELLNHINTWEKEEQFIKDGWITSVNKSGFAAMFYGVFKKSIAGDPKRMEFWQQKCNKIKHPVYVRELLYAMQQLVERGQHDMLEEYLIISKKVLIRSNEERHSEKGKTWKRREPGWSSARWPICELISEYLKKKVKPLPSVWKHLSSVLTMLCIQYDRTLDDEQSQYHDNRNPANKGLNCIRSRSLEALVEFALIAKQYNDSSYVSTAKKVIEQRLSPQTEYVLKPEEYAILGVNYLRLHFLDKEWARKNRSAFFPQDNLPAWSAAFGAFISYCKPCKEMFEIASENFAFAMQNLDKFRAKDNYGDAMINAFELKLFNFYLADDYSLAEKESLLEQYYQQTSSDKKGRGDLIYKVGDHLRDKDNKLSTESREKMLDFFRVRIAAGDFVKMDSFSPWLDVEQLQLKERLSACLEVLKTCEIESFSTHVWLKKLCKMLPDCTAEVVSCFAELVCCENSNITHIDKEKVKVIVTAGRESGSEPVYKDANRAVSCLLGKNLISLDDLED